MNRIATFLAGLAVGAVVLGTAVALPITGATDPARIIPLVNQHILNWMSFPAAENGELQLLGPNAFTTNGSKTYAVFVDDAGTPWYALVIATASP